MAKNVCQSCGMPLAKDEKGGGSNADGSLSDIFCSHCYQDGCFVQPEMTAGQMQELVRNKLKTMGFPSWVAWFFVRGIPKLGRWHKA